MIIEKIWNRFYHIWRGAQNYRWSFRLVLFLKEAGLTKIVKSVLLYFRDRSLRKHPSKGMLEARTFFDENRERISAVESMLADDRSREIWGGVLQYRMFRTPYKKGNYSLKDQYFPEDIIHIRNGEVFIDGGAYTGDTIRELIKAARRQNQKIKKVIAFEPNEENYRILKDSWKTEKVELINKGLSEKEEVLLFYEYGNASRLTKDVDEATTQVPVTNIDAIPSCREATFIKMDIEGAELDALKGGRETIVRNHPKLAICIYHNNEHMLAIAEYIHEIAPEYKLYVRHHSKGGNETVLYAVI